MIHTHVAGIHYRHRWLQVTNSTLKLTNNPKNKCSTHPRIFDDFFHLDFCRVRNSLIRTKNTFFHFQVTPTKIYEISKLRPFCVLHQNLRFDSKLSTCHTIFQDSISIAFVIFPGRWAMNANTV